MNLMTICTYNWLKDYVPRFLYMMNHYAYGLKAHIVVPVRKHEESLAKAIHTALEPHFTKVVVVAQPDNNVLMYSDHLRGTLLKLFGISEGLYTDIDVDILGDLLPLQAEQPDKKILWCADPVNMEAIDWQLRQSRLDNTPPYMMSGFFYAREDMGDKFRDIYNTLGGAARYDVQGTAIWNMLRLQNPNDFGRVDDSWHSTWFDVPRTLGCRMAHFSGRWKELRPYMSYAPAAKGMTATLNQFKISYPGYELEL